MYGNYRTFGQTEVNGKSYWIITNLSSAAPRDTFLIREEVNTGKVWFKYWCCEDGVDTNEILMIDYSMNIGDTILLINHFSPHIVDSIYYVNGLKYLRLEDNQNYVGYFIESVGSSFGLSYSVRGLCIADYLMCMKKDQIINYVNPNYSQYCGLANTDVNDRNLPQPLLRIYPNPADDYFTIDGLDLNKKYLFKIVDAFGKVHKEGFIQDKTNVSTLLSGIYFLQVKHKNFTKYFTISVF